MFTHLGNEVPYPWCPLESIVIFHLILENFDSRVHDFCRTIETMVQDRTENFPLKIFCLFITPLSRSVIMTTPRDISLGQGTRKTRLVSVIDFQTQRSGKSLETPRFLFPHRERWNKSEPLVPLRLVSFSLYLYWLTYYTVFLINRNVMNTVIPFPVPSYPVVRRFSSSRNYIRTSPELQPYSYDRVSGRTWWLDLRPTWHRKNRLRSYFI